MLTYNMDVEGRSMWLRATPNNAVLAQPFYATEAGLFYGRSHFATARTDKESYILFYTLAGAGLIEQNEQHIELPQGAALLMNCRTPQSYCTAPGYDVWEHYWVHLDGVGVKTLADSVQSQGRLTAAHVSRMEMQPLFETLFAEWKKETTTAQIEIGLTLHKMLALLAHQQLSGDESRSNRTMIKQIADYIRAHYAEPINLDMLLAQIPVSKSWFLRLFRQYMGTTPYNFFVIHPYYPRKRTAGSDRFPCRRGCPPGWLLRMKSNFSTRFSSMTGQMPAAIPQKRTEAFCPKFINTRQSTVS